MDIQCQFQFIRLLIFVPIESAYAISYHRLNGSSSPVLTATCLSLESLWLFYFFFLNRPGGHIFWCHSRATKELPLHSTNKKVQQSWQTSALAMRLPLARLISMPVIFRLLPSSSIVILVFYSFSTDISEQHVWELWVWIQSTGLTLPLRVTPMNNPI